MQSTCLDASGNLVTQTITATAQIVVVTDSSGNTVTGIIFSM